MFNTDSSSVGMRVLAVMMALALVATGALAAPVIDTETTDTATTSDVTDGSTMAVGFEANASNTTWVEASGMESDGKLEFIDSDNQVVYTNATPEATNASQGYYAFNISHDELNNVPIQSGANETYTVKLYNNSTVDNPATSNITVYLEGVEGRTVVNVGETLASNEDVTTLETDGFTLPLSETSLFADDTAEVEQDNLAINGSNSTVTYHFANSSTADRFSSAAESAEAGDLLISQQAFVDGEPVPVYYNEASSDVTQGEDTYAVYDDAADDLTIHTGSAQDGATSIDVHVLGNQAWSVNDLWTLADGVSEFGSFVGQKATAGL